MKKSILNLMSLMLFATVIFTSCQQTKGEEDTEEASTEEVSEEAASEEGSTEEEPQQVASPRKQSSGSIGEVTVNVDYGSPSVKEREVWGKMEPYGTVWRAGANETTSFEFSGDVTINGENLPAGKYGFFIIPNENEDWVIIFNEEWSRDLHNAWGAFGYKQDKDVLRVNVTPDWADDSIEQLSYEVNSDGVNFAWEKARINLIIEAK